MPGPLPSFDPALASRVTADVLEPHQQRTAQNFQTATNFYQQYMLKHPFLSDFHSRAELLHAGLLEADCTVTSYVPQPFPLRVGKRRYTPDCYVLRDGGQRTVIELKPDGDFNEALCVPLTHFFAEHGMAFVVISNEAIYERRIEAENWLEIVRILQISRDCETADAEQFVLETLLDKGPCSLGDLVDPGDRERTYLEEIAVFRLLHRGRLVGELTARSLDFDTGLSLCV